MVSQPTASGPPIIPRIRRAIPCQVCYSAFLADKAASQTIPGGPGKQTQPAPRDCAIFRVARLTCRHHEPSREKREDGL